MPKIPPREGNKPDVRLACQVGGGGSLSKKNFERHLKAPAADQQLPAPSTRLALGADIVKTVGDDAFGTTEGGLPALLVSYYYLKPFLENRHRYHFRDWVMDSGAFSAHNSGAVIRLQDYIDCCKELMSKDEKLTEIFALDVIGDWRAGLANTEEMWRQGIPAIPCFHYGEPWSILKGLAKDYPKIALGGCVGKRDKDKFASECFSRIWPKKIHGFGFGAEKSIMLLPWHSVDATNWELGPCAFGRWAAFGKLSWKGSNQNLRAEVEWYLDLERRAQARWKKEMVILEALPDVSPAVRLGLMPKQGKERDINLKALGATDPPSVRFACVGGAQGEMNGALKGADLRGLEPAQPVPPPTIRLAQKESGREKGKGLERES